MDELIVLSLMRRTTDAEERVLAEWRAASAANEEHYRSLARTWFAVESARSRPETAPPAVHRILSDAAAPARHRHRVSRRRGFQLAVAAAVAAIVAVPLLLRWSASHDQMVHVATGAGELVTVQLGDGSTARVAPETRLRFHANGREAWLVGRAFFGIKPDPERPFRIHTPTGQAVVLGTRFDLTADSTDLRLVVVEGRVALSAKGDRVEVGAGEVSRLVGDSAVVEPDADPFATLAWLGDVFIFQETPVRDVAIELEQRYGQTIEVPDSIIAKRTVSAVFTHQSFDQVVATICRVIDARCEVRDGGVEITR